MMPLTLKERRGGVHVKGVNSEGDDAFNDNVPHGILYSLVKFQGHYGV